MKTKLLRKIRKRFTIYHHGNYYYLIEPAKKRILYSSANIKWTILEAIKLTIGKFSYRILRNRNELKIHQRKQKSENSKVLKSFKKQRE